MPLPPRCLGETHVAGLRDRSSVDFKIRTESAGDLRCMRDCMMTLRGETHDCSVPVHGRVSLQTSPQLFLSNSAQSPYLSNSGMMPISRTLCTPATAGKHQGSRRSVDTVPHRYGTGLHKVGSGGALQAGAYKKSPTCVLLVCSSKRVEKSKSAELTLRPIIYHNKSPPYASQSAYLSNWLSSPRQFQSGS